MKKTFRIIVAGMLLVSALVMSTFAAPSVATAFDSVTEDAVFVQQSAQSELLAVSASGTCGNKLSWSLDTDGVLTISGTGDMTDWSSVESTPWYDYMSDIKSIVVENGVTSIGNNAFGILDAGDIEVDYDDLFYKVLYSGTIGSISWQIGDNGVLYLSGTGALADYASYSAVPWSAYVSSISNVSIDSGITGIGSYAFYGITNLTKISMPDTVTSLGSYALAECTSLKEVFLGGVNSVPANAFQNCSSLESLKFGSYDSYLALIDNLKDSLSCLYYVGDNGRIAEVTLPASVIDIGANSFDGLFGIVTGYKGSYAEQYAESKNFVFIPYEVVINIGEKASASNVRYAEIDGFQYEITENNNTYTVCPGKNTLVQVVEKASAASIYAVSTKYYYVDYLNLEYSEVAELGSYMDNGAEATIRIRNPLAIRFTSKVSTLAKDETEAFVIEEYGYIVGVQSLIDKTGSQLNFDFRNYVTGVAYNKNEDIDLIFNGDDDDWCIFTGVLKNVPEKNYETVVTSKNYTKVTINGEVFTVYGEPVSTSMYASAKALIDSGLVTDAQKAELQKIIDVVEGKELPGELGIPGTDLFS
ncbi:MAG: leucine-rich repeat domain-containing protein [Clostridia bacterium]|nr:leucine-rich repeat domain-containing protein [Clostridia bacterium]